MLIIVRFQELLKRVRYSDWALKEQIEKGDKERHGNEMD